MGRLHLNLTQLEHDLLRVRLLASPHVQLLWSWLILSISPVQSQPVRPLDDRAAHTAPRSRFQVELEDHMSEEYADQTLHALISWGRYAEAFAYDEAARTFSLEDPK
ncbi:AAA-associated domain-containing protein [Methylobacterium sp. HMF5984]|uniref:AAA-associated domain-containing protein n=1 Tax=Methylobacterium sp. HMF5984 TaxID=3367370 RepID=UPI00385220DC